MTGETPKAMVLAAGYGTRLGKMGETRPKPLTMVGHQPVISHVLDKLAAAGVRECVINTHHLGDMVKKQVGASHGPLVVAYTDEAKLLDVAGGIANALGLLGDEPFILANSDICSDLDFALLAAAARNMDDDLACLALGDNPDFRPRGDFSLHGGRVARLQGVGLTYIGCAAISPRLFAQVAPGQKAALPPLLHDAIAAGKVAGIRHKGWWVDAGTPGRIEEARRKMGA